MTKRQLDQAMMYMFHMGEYYNYRYTSYRNYDYDKPSCYGMPHEFNLGNTPLNEELDLC